MIHAFDLGSKFDDDKHPNQHANRLAASWPVRLFQIDWRNDRWKNTHTHTRSPSSTEGEIASISVSSPENFPSFYGFLEGGVLFFANFLLSRERAKPIITHTSARNIFEEHLSRVHRAHTFWSPCVRAFILFWHVYALFDCWQVTEGRWERKKRTLQFIHEY